MAINLVKGQRVNLVKDGGGSLDNILVGFGWDSASSKGKGLSESFFDAGQTNIDCDFSVMILNNDGKFLKREDLVYFGNLIHPFRKVTHTGDNFTGEGECGDEQVLVQLSKLPADYGKIVFILNVDDCLNMNQHLGMINNAFIRIVDVTSKKEFLRYNLTDDYSGKTLLIVGELYKHNGEWKFGAVGEVTTDFGLYKEKFSVKFYTTDNKIRREYMKKISECNGIIEKSDCESLKNAYKKLMENIDDKNDKVKIVNAGIFNAGKSTLFNAMIEDEVFMTGDIPTTSKNTSYETDKYIMVDTPGIDANELDEIEAEKAYKNADLIMFIHNIIDGEINLIQMNFLSKILKYFPDETDIRDRFLIVLSNKDQIEISKIEEVKSIIQNQLIKKLNINIDGIFVVDSETHIAGLKNKNALLMKGTGIKELREYIRNIAEVLYVNRESFNKKRLIENKKNLFKEIDTYLENESKKFRPHIERTENLKKDVEAIEEIIENIEKLKKQSEFYKFEFNKNIECNYFIDLDNTDSCSGYKYSSETAAERAGREAYNKYVYDEAKNEVSDVICAFEEKFRNYEYYEVNEDNFYYKLNTLASKSMKSLIDYISEKTKNIDNFVITRVNLDFSIQPKQIDILSYINSYKIREILSNLGDKDRYHFKIRTNYTIEYKDGLFGKSKEIKKYEYDISDAVFALEDKFSDRVKYAVERINSKLNDKLNEFNETLINEFEKRFILLEKNIEDLKNKKKQQLKEIGIEISGFEELENEYLNIKNIIDCTMKF